MHPPTCPDLPWWLVTPPFSRVPRTEAPLPHLRATAGLQAAFALLRS